MGSCPSAAGVLRHIVWLDHPFLVVHCGSTLGTNLLFEMNRPGEKCARTALYVVLDNKLRGTGLTEFVPRGRHFPNAGPGDTYWPMLDL